MHAMRPPSFPSFVKPSGHCQIRPLKRTWALSVRGGDEGGLGGAARAWFRTFRYPAELEARVGSCAIVMGSMLAVGRGGKMRLGRCCISRGFGDTIGW